jgi:hypothetical protein
MATLVLAAPLVPVSNIPGSSGLAITLLPTTYAGQPLTTVSLIQFPNNGAVLLHLIIAGADTPVLQPLVETNAILGVSLLASAAFTTSATSTGHQYLFGPFSPRVFNDANGLVNITVTGTVSSSSFAGLLTLPGAAS